MKSRRISSEIENVQRRKVTGEEVGAVPPAGVAGGQDGKQDEVGHDQDNANRAYGPRAHLTRLQ
jgi:hypothetical protein